MGVVSSFCPQEATFKNKGMKTKYSAGFTLIEIMIVVAIIAVLTAVAIPNILNAIEKTQRQTCAINRKNIDGAKLQWALDHKKPTDEVPTDTDLFGAGAYIEHKPDCPAGGAYAINAVEAKCHCSVGTHAP
jgi:prepilin-type N-terminal cleavage/methylation domain-containing protein